MSKAPERGAMLQSTLGDALGSVIGIALVTSLLLAACVLAGVALAVAWGLRASTDATAVGTVAGVLVGGVAWAVAPGELVGPAAAVLAGFAGVAIGHSARGRVRRPPFQSRPYGLVIVAVAAAAVLAGVAFWAYLLGLETDVLGALAENPGEAVVVLAITLLPVAAGGAVLHRELARGFRG